MRIRHTLSIAAGILVVAVAAFVVLNQSGPSTSSSVKTAGLNVPPQATAMHHYGAEFGAVSDSLTSPDNVTFKIVGIQRGASEWLFHIHAHNNGKQSISMLDAATNHYFMIGGRGTPGTPITADQIFRKLTPLASSRPDLAAHPALAQTVAPGADADGWLIVDLSNYKYQPIQLLYVYGTVTAPACANPQDQSTCHPSTGYRTIVWNL